MRANFWSVNYNERAFITMKEKKEVVDSSISFPARYYWKNIVIFNEKLTNCLFSLQYDVANFIFSFKYRQQKVDQNVSEKLLIFVTIRQKILSLNFSYLTRKFQIYAFVERCCFLTFSFEGKFRGCDISVKRKHTKTNENMTFSVLFTNFHQKKILFFIQ